MRSILQNITLSLTAVLLALAATGCGSDNTVASEPVGEADKCVLMLSTGIIERSRAGEATADSDKMHTLRVVIVDQDGSVEHNDFVGFGSQPLAECFRIYEVTPQRNKTIYLIANEDGTKADITPTLENFNATTVENLVFELGNGPVPMTSVYKVTSPAAGERLDLEMHVVRAATKISYRFVNYRSSKITVNNVQVSSVANEMYLMPHVGSRDLTKTFDGVSMPWIDWLKKVSDESQKNLEYPSDYDPELAESRGWITDYAIPATATHSVKTLDMGLELPADMGLDENRRPIPDQKDIKPVVSDEYFMRESRYGANANGVQNYTMAFNLTEYKCTSMHNGESGKLVLEYDTAGTQLRFDGIEFNNLKALFRNTHVLVDVEIKSEIFVKVIPYAECKLDPIFGLTPKTTTN